jgi:hypothetical protein
MFSSGNLFPWKFMANSQSADIKSDRTIGFFSKERTILSTQTQILIYLALLAVFDAIIPIPIAAMAMIMVFFQKPRWFKDWIDEIYRS